MDKLITLEQAEKNIEGMAEKVITPEFLDHVWFLAAFTFGFGISELMKQINVISILFVVTGGLLIISVWYVRKNFEWKKEEGETT